MGMAHPMPALNSQTVNMKLICSVLLLAAAALANTVGRQDEDTLGKRQMYREVLSNLTAIAETDLGECDPANIAGCTGTILAAIGTCITGAITGPGDVILCVGAILGVGSACFDCICEVLEQLDLCYDWGCLKC